MTTIPRRSAPMAADGDQLQVVAFRVGGHDFAVDVFQVRRVVPCEPPFHEGVIRVRGAAVPVIDLRTRFSLPTAPVGAERRILIVEGGEGMGPVGMVVDTASEVLRVQADAIVPPPPTVRGLAAEYVQGIIRLPERSLLLLRTTRLLHATERIELEQSSGEAHG